MSDQSAPAPTFQPLAATLVARSNDVERVDDMAGGISRLLGSITLTGYGEAIVSVNFPIRFLEKPSPSCMGEMGPSSILQNGCFPTINGVVKDWMWDVRSDTGTRFYSGVSFALVVTGQPEQAVIFHYQMEGKALRNPV